VSYTLRPLPEWPHTATSPRRYAQFKHNGRSIPWEQTRRELQYEVDQLSDSRYETDIIIGVGLTEHDIRQDGSPRANARPMLHPGVEISFDSRYGRLTYATDVFTTWQDNARAVAKGLEALRAIDRWGVAKRGQQYAGFALLTAGPGKEELGRSLVDRFGGVREALQATHPDTGGDTASERDFDAVMAYKRAEGK
jgi:hypothetical protein